MNEMRAPANAISPEVNRPVAADFFQLTGREIYFFYFTNRIEEFGPTSSEHIETIKKIPFVASKIKLTWQSERRDSAVFQFEENVCAKIKELVQEQIPPDVICWPLDPAQTEDVVMIKVPASLNRVNQKTPLRKTCERIASCVQWRFTAEKDGSKVLSGRATDEQLFLKIRQEARSFPLNSPAEVDWLPENKDLSGSEGKGQCP